METVNMCTEKIAMLLGKCDSEDRNFPATDLYNEGWMLRIVLNWFASNPNVQHCMSFSRSDKWYSEARLPSPFLARKRGDKMGEAYTCADGVVGDICIGKNSKGGLSLKEKANRFLVIEAKMFSRLSKGVTNAPYFHQAARSVACIAEVIHRAKIAPNTFEKIGFYVIAPEEQIRKGTFSEQLDSINETVAKRVVEYDDPKTENWFTECFEPMQKVIHIRETSWEEIIAFIGKNDCRSGEMITTFYDKCKTYN